MTIREASSLDVGVPATYLFLNLEGCDPLKRRLGKKAVQRHLNGHYEAIRDAIGSYSGTQVRPTGTGIGATFYSASRAVGCALRIQRVIAKRNAASPERAVKVRIGLNTVEPLAQVDDLNGASTQLARRICESAEPGQILVADAVRQLVGGKGFKLEPVEVKTLKGFEEPVALYRLDMR